MKSHFASLSIAVAVAVFSLQGDARAGTYSGEIECGTAQDLAIYSNIHDSVEVVTVKYSHGCSKGGIGLTKKAGSTSSWIAGCELLVKGITKNEAMCSFDLEANESVYIVQTGDYTESTGSGHKWTAQGRL
ncbi:MAG: hypothetical protein IPK82_00255 [Polyangiaceae bacterium]|nr:hypothetical protein [Polyangiaceae bacterium]